MDSGQFASQRWWSRSQQFLLLYHPLQAHCRFRVTYLAIVANRTTNFSRHICQPGQLNLVRFWRPYPPNNLSGIGLVCLKIRNCWKPISVLHTIGLPFLLPEARGRPLPPLSTGGSSLSCWEGPSFLFRVKSKGPKSEAQRADSRGVVLGEGAAGHSTPASR